MDFGPYVPPDYNKTSSPMPPAPSQPAAPYRPKNLIRIHPTPPPPPPPPQAPPPEAKAPQQPPSLNRRALKKFLIGAAVLIALIMIPGGTVYYWQGWVFLAIFIGWTGLITYYLAKQNPALLERRMKAGAGAETRTEQKKIMRVIGIASAALVVFPAFDYRFHLSPIPNSISLIGDVLLIIGFVIVFWVLTVNDYGAATIQTFEGQKVISTGPYSIIRHPMYAGALILLIGVPLALGSWFGFLALIPITIGLCLRLLDEERFLTMNLEGYAAYTDKVHWRLIPLIW